jgi:putative MATE family efflux protein
MEEKLSKKLIRVALPIAAQSLIAASLSLVDNLMVGHLGEEALASVGLSTQFMFVYWMLLFGFSGGAITYMSQFFGKGDISSIRRVAGITATVSFAIGLVFFCVSFFAPERVIGIFTDIPVVIEMGTPFVRLSAFVFPVQAIVVPLTAALKATQQTSLPLKISVVVFSVNTLLCILLINGFFGFPKMGIMGAATATLVSRFIEVILYLIVVFARKNLIAGPLREFFTWTKDLFRRVLANSIPTMSNEALWAIGISLYNAAFGRIGVTEFAAVQAGNTIFNIFSLVCFAIGDGMLILCGEKLGRGETEEAYTMGRRILKFAVLFGAVCGAILIFTAQFIVKLFEFTDQGAHYATLILVVYGITLFVKIHNATILVGALRAGGDTRVGMIIDLGTVWCIGVPLAFLGALVFQVPVYWVVALVQLEEIVKFFIMHKRFVSRKWLRDLVEDI